MYQITIVDDICGAAYDKLIKCLIRQSDSFLFHLPNMGKLIVNERNMDLFPEYSLGYIEETDQDEHKEYMTSMQPLLDTIQSDIIDHHKDTGYLDQVSSIEMEVFNVSISKNTQMFFEKNDRILSWKYPKFPEDPCFISNGKCIFQCIAHEEMCYLNYYNAEILQLLKENDIEFFRSK